MELWLCRTPYIEHAGDPDKEGLAWEYGDTYRPHRVRAAHAVGMRNYLARYPYKRAHHRQGLPDGYPAICPFCAYEPNRSGCGFVTV